MFLAAARLTLLCLIASTAALSACVLFRGATPDAVLAYLRFDDGSLLWLRDVERGRSRPLAHTAGAFNWSWSPDGRWLAYSILDEQEFPTQLYRFETQTSSALSYFNSGDFYLMGWSPDSRILLLWATVPGQIAYYAVDIGEVLPATTIAGTASPTSVLWSPDSRTLYYVDAAERLAALPTRCLNPQAVCVASRVQVVGDQRISALLGWTPNGEMMVSIASESGTPQVHRLDLETGEFGLLLANPLPGAVPVWSPDGERLAASLAVMPNGGDLARTEPIPGLYLVPPSMEQPDLLLTGVAGQLGWSPVGQLLSFELIARVGNDRSIWLYDREQHTFKSHTPPNTLEASPGWVRYHGKPFEWHAAALFEMVFIVLYWVLRGRAK